MKDNIQKYLESECLKQEQLRKIINANQINKDSCNAFSISSIKFKKQFYENRNKNENN